ncbi:hypothetical protein DYQ86_05355 [Acidobacteria bacterium AB60]|nr:hypothetical protein DYQ86_05355 [Acidobacteria bacterium AB60]
MRPNLKPTHTVPGAYVEETDEADNGVINDALGTIDTADSSGVEDELETGEAKSGNFDTQED